MVVQKLRGPDSNEQYGGMSPACFHYTTPQVSKCFKKHNKNTIV